MLATTQTVRIPSSARFSFEVSAADQLLVSVPSDPDSDPPTIDSTAWTLPDGLTEIESSNTDTTFKLVLNSSAIANGAILTATCNLTLSTDDIVPVEVPMVIGALTVRRAR